MRRRKLLVAGALGVVGRPLMIHCEQVGVAAIGLSRRAPDYPSRLPFHALDLHDAAACDRLLAAESDVTHLVYAAWQPGATRQAEVEPNLAMLRNLLLAAQRFAPGLRHVTLLQGAKAYGSHLGPFRTPARETDPRHMPPNFYYDQQDFLAAEQRGKGWTWTIFRPVTVYGLAFGNPMNLTHVIAVYAAISKELGLPLRFPGTAGAYAVLRQAVDAELLARAILWAGESEAAANEIFNIANGDHFRWAQMWELFAQLLHMPLAEPQRIPLSEFMAAKGDVWERIVARHGLAPYHYRDLAAWPFGEANFNREYDNVLETLKLRKHGFDGWVDSRDMFERHFRQLQQARIIPPV